MKLFSHVSLGIIGWNLQQNGNLIPNLIFPFCTLHNKQRHRYANMNMDKKPAFLSSNPVSIQFIKGIRGCELLQQAFARLPKILFYNKELHLNHPQQGSNQEDDSQQEFTKRDKWIGVCEFELEIEDFELFFHVIVFDFEGVYFILQLSIYSHFGHESSLGVSLTGKIQCCDLVTLFDKVSQSYGHCLSGFLHLY